MKWKSLFGDSKPKSSKSATPAGLCPNCKASPVALNPNTGQYFDYCSRTCANQNQPTRSVQNQNNQGNQGNQGNGTSVSTLCEHCKKKPKFKDGTKVHPYCGRTCSKLANGSTPASPTNPPTSATTTTTPTSATPTTPATPAPPTFIAIVTTPAPSRLRPATSTINRSTSSGPTCQTPGCLLPAFVDGSGVPSKHCSKRHRQWGVRGCISCRAAPRVATLLMCQPCHDNAVGMAPALVEVPEDHDNYKSVEKQFQQTWRHGTTCPEVRAVYKIINTTASLKKYEQYLDGIEAVRDFASVNKPRGNENRRWHGTRRKCNIGDKGITTFCTDTKCSLCCIIKTSFDLKFFKGATGWGRFGAGIYTSSTSSKSNDYSYNESVSNWKALLLNKVVVGKGMKLVLDDPTLTEPPPGYDSVLAEVVPGGAVNYDELVVYHNDAARPSYLVMYESP